tara:strand:- start:4648 stop:5556 length:909 start_codon:yes stop_codon:yes gene_type:complete
MSQPRKPIPKTQRSISIDKQSPFEGIEGRGIQSNPNSSDSRYNSKENYQSTGIEFNRSEQMSFQDDTIKQYSVGIKDIDEAVFYYFQNIIKPFVYQNGERREVPVIYGSPERWKSFQRDGYYRDKKGAIMLPIIVIKRNTLTKDRTVANKLDANQPNLYGIYSKTFSSKNFYGNFAALNNRKPVETFHIVAQPDYITMEYSCIIQTYYMEQLNKIIESCEYASDSYWGNPNRFQFQSYIDSFNTTTELTTNQDRLVKGTFNIRLRGYILPDTLQKELSSIKKYNSKAKVTITSETVSDINNL